MIFPLALGPDNRLLKVEAVAAGVGLLRRLTDLGIIRGAEIRLINRHATGPVIVDIKGARLALGRGVAHRIMVSEASDDLK